MSNSMRWLFHSRRMPSREGFTRKSRLFSEDVIAQERFWGLTVAEGVPRADLAQPLDWPLFVGFEALAQQRDAICGVLVPLHETTALVTFIGMMITDAKRYEDADSAFDELRRMAPVHNGALIQVYTQKHREQSMGNHFLYFHFAGDCLAFGFLLCGLIGGGFMAGWQLGW